MWKIGDFGVVKRYNLFITPKSHFPEKWGIWTVVVQITAQSPFFGVSME
jgi:hypothetical protein